MKRIGSVFEVIISLEILDKASKLACKTRKNKNEVISFLEKKDILLEKLHKELSEGTYRSSEYRMFVINEKGKDRWVADLPLYPDRIVHWAICLVVEDRLNKSLIDQTYACVKGRGQHDAVNKVCEYIRKDHRLRYALTIDVRKFFQSIDKDILKNKLESKFKDRRFLNLMFQLIDEYPHDGIPLGNRYSPMLANLYLSDLDHLLKERYHVHYIVSFMDDRCILGYSKIWLHKIRGIIDEELKKMKLELKKNYQVFPIDKRGILFLGYRIYSDHVMLSKTTKKRMIAACEVIRERDEKDMIFMAEHDRGTLASYHGVLSHCDGLHIHHIYIDPLMKRIER